MGGHIMRYTLCVCLFVCHVLAVHSKTELYNIQPFRNLILFLPQMALNGLYLC